MGTYSQLENPDAISRGDDSRKAFMGLTLKEAYSLCQFLSSREPVTGMSQGIAPMGIFPGI